MGWFSPKNILTDLKILLIEDAPSLAAVRTVIKRLRTTKLPTRTAAGLELASFQGVSKPHISLSPEISASRVGADPILGSVPERRSQLRTDKQPMLRANSQPPLSQPATGSKPDPVRAPSEPPEHRGGIHGTNPGIPAKSTHGRGTGRGGDSVPPATSSPGLAAANQPLAGTKLGVAPPPQMARSPIKTAAAQPAKSNRMWLLIGALVAIAAGVALALALV